MREGGGLSSVITSQTALAVPMFFPVGHAPRRHQNRTNVGNQPAW